MHRSYEHEDYQLLKETYYWRKLLILSIINRIQYPKFIIFVSWSYCEGKRCVLADAHSKHLSPHSNRGTSPLYPPRFHSSQNFPSKELRSQPPVLTVLQYRLFFTNFGNRLFYFQNNLKAPELHTLWYNCLFSFVENSIANHFIWCPQLICYNVQNNHSSLIFTSASCFSTFKWHPHSGWKILAIFPLSMETMVYFGYLLICVQDLKNMAAAAYSIQFNKTLSKGEFKSFTFVL